MNHSRTFLITGATGSIGYAIAKMIAENLENKLVILARNTHKAESTTSRIQDETGNGKVSFIKADLSRKSEIMEAADKWTGTLDVLVNNAGATPRRREETAEGIEMQWATNVLGYFWMIKYFTKHLSLSSSARIVNVASYWAGDMELQDPEFKRRHYNNDTAYRQSKQADRMLTVAFADQLKNRNITVNACHPGDVRSTLASNLGYGGHETPEQGAATPVWLATSTVVEGISGKYFEHMQETNCRFGRDMNKVNQLYEICESY